MNALNADHFGRPREATRIRPNPADLIAPKRATRIRPDHLSKALPDHASEMCSIAGSLWPSRDGSDRAVLDKVIFIHHGKKGDGGDERDIARGSGAIYAGVDWMYKFDPVDDARKKITKMQRARAQKDTDAEDTSSAAPLSTPPVQPPVVKAGDSEARPAG